MKKIFILFSFEKSAEKLTSNQRAQVGEGLKAFKDFVFLGTSPFGFRFKKLQGDKYEFRVNVALRVVVKVDKENFYLVMVGGHDEVRRYLKNH